MEGRRGEADMTAACAERPAGWELWGAQTAASVLHESAVSSWNCHPLTHLFHPADTPIHPRSLWRTSRGRHRLLLMWCESGDEEARGRLVPNNEEDKEKLGISISGHEHSMQLFETFKAIVYHSLADQHIPTSGFY